MLICGQTQVSHDDGIDGLRAAPPAAVGLHQGLDRSQRAPGSRPCSSSGFRAKA